jgi:hypothetical protein
MNSTDFIVLIMERLDEAWKAGIDREMFLEHLAVDFSRGIPILLFQNWCIKQNHILF